MNLEVRAALYAAFAHDEAEKETARWLQTHFNIFVAVENLSWEHLDELEDATVLYERNIFKWVLPRWLELLSVDSAPRWTLDRDSLGWKLQHAQWLSWSAGQVETVRCLFDEWSAKALRESEMEEFVEFINEIENDAWRYLDVWLRARPVEVAQWAWKNSWARPGILRSWLVSMRVEEKWEEIFFRNPEGQHAQLLSDVIQLARSLRALETRKSAA